MWAFAFQVSLYENVVVCSPVLLHREVAFIWKVVSAVARPSTHNSLRGASPQALSGLPAPLSTLLLYKQAQVHTHSLCNYCQGRLCRENGLQPSCCTVLPAGSTSNVDSLYSDHFQNNGGLTDQRESRGPDGNSTTTCYDVYLCHFVFHY